MLYYSGKSNIHETKNMHKKEKLNQVKRKPTIEDSYLENIKNFKNSSNDPIKRL